MSEQTRKARWTWFWAASGVTTLAIAALVVFVGFTWWKVALFGWLPLVLVELFAVLFAGRREDRHRWPSFIAIALAGILVCAWLVFIEGMTPWKVAAFGLVPFVVTVFLVTMFVKRRVAPYRVVQIFSAILLNAYVLAYLQDQILYQGFFKFIPQPVLNCYGGPLAVFACPIGSTQQMLGMKMMPWLPLGIFVVIGAIVGRAACAWLCPFGLWQDLLYKVKVGARAKGKRWVSFGVITGTAFVLSLLLTLLVGLAWWKVFLFGFLPFTGLVLAVAIKGKLDIPKRMWLGGFLAATGMGALLWAKFDIGIGVAAGFLLMVLLGLTGRWFAAIFAAAGGFLVGWLGNPEFATGPLSGITLGLAAGAAGFGLVLLFDKAIKVRLSATYLKYGILLLVAGLASYLTVEPWFCKLCPQGTFGAGIPLVLWDPVNALRGLVGWLYWVKVGILLLVVVAAIAIKRPFCRVICPIGAIYAPFNKVSLLKMKLETKACRGCTLCTKVCPMNISVYEDPNQLECIRCFECKWACRHTDIRITC